MTPITIPAAEHRNLVAHIGKHIGKTTKIFREHSAKSPQLEIHAVAPSREYPRWSLTTVGMSAIPMTCPPILPHLLYAELTTTLPPDWKLDTESFKDPRWYWPISWLLSSARVPHDRKTYFAHGHTVQMDKKHFDDCPFVAALVSVTSPNIPKAFRQFIFNHKTVNIFTPVPIYPDELQIALNGDNDSLMERVDALPFHWEPFDIGRPRIK